MADYTMAQIRSMQEEATRRVRDMNRRSKSNIEKPKDVQKNEPIQNPSQNHKTAPTRQNNANNQANIPKQHSPAPPPPAQTAPHKNPLNFLQSLDLKNLISGGEQSMLLLLVMILMTDSSEDDYLIYALIYIML